MSQLLNLCNWYLTWNMCKHIDTHTATRSSLPSLSATFFKISSWVAQQWEQFAF